MTQEEIIDLQKELLKVKLLLQKCNGDIVRADRELKSERNKVLDEAIDNVTKLGNDVDPIFQVAFYTIVNELKALKVDL